MNHAYYMQQALDLAAQGWPQVAPNPMVGCVIVKNNEVVAKGFHKKYGGPHAEVEAINDLPAGVLPADCILYVTLEPCSYFGKTPPCADLIISEGFKTVVVACKDPNPLVSGNGIKKLQESGIAVVTGVLEAEARQLNRRFITCFEENRPYLILKWAQTADGFISRIPAPVNRNENIITRPEAQAYVHRLRADTMGIVVGKNTVLNDNPSLTTRLVEGKNPVRIFIDKKLEVPGDFNIYNAEAPTIVFNALKEDKKDHIQFIKLDFSGNVLGQMLQELYRLSIQSLLVEGGSSLLYSFIDQHLWDEVLVFQNPSLFFGQGLKAPVFALKNTFELIGDDKLFKHYRNETLEAGSAPKEVF